MSANLSVDDLPLLATFTALINRPKPMSGGIMAQLYASDGEDADAVVHLGLSAIQDAVVDVELRDGDKTGEEMGGFRAALRRPVPRLTGMIAMFFGADGPQADAIVALSISKFQQARVHVTVRLVRDPSGAVATKAQKPKREDIFKMLWASSFFLTPAVWQVVGSVPLYAEWLKENYPCAVYECREPYFCEHPACGGWGTLTVCERHSRMPFSEARGISTSYAQKAWALSRMRSLLKIGSMTHIEPDQLIEFCRQHQIYKFLPKNLLEAA